MFGEVVAVRVHHGDEVPVKLVQHQGGLLTQRPALSVVCRQLGTEITNNEVLTSIQ